MDLNEIQKETDEMLRQAIGQLTQPLPAAPPAAGVSLIGVKRELSKASTARDEQQQRIDKEMATTQAATGQLKQGYEDAATAKADLARAEAERAQKTADQFMLFQKMFGMDPSHGSEISVLAEEIKRQTPIALDKLNRIQEMQAVGPLDNPLEWLYNTIQLPSAIQDYNRNADRINSMQATVNAGVNTARNAAQLGEKTIPTVTAAEAAAKAKFASAEALQLAAAADIALSKTNVEFGAKKMANDLAILSATQNTTQLELENSKAAYAASIDKIRLAESHSQRLLTAAGLLEKLGQTRALDRMLANYDQFIGNPAGTTTRSVFMTLGNEQQQNIAAIAAGNGGSDPYQFLLNMRKARPGPLLSMETQNLLNFLEEKASKISKSLEGQVPKEVMPIRIGEELRKQLDQDRKLPNTSKLFAEVSPAIMLQSNLVDPESRLGKILAPLAASGTSPTTEIVVKTIAQEFKNPTEAGQVISEYYRNNVAHLNKALNLQFAGIKPLDNYNVSYAPYMFFGAKIYDLTRADRATAYVLAIQSGESVRSNVRRAFPLGSAIQQGVQQYQQQNR